MPETHEALPVHGYQAQSASNVNEVNHNKQLEENILRRLDFLSTNMDIDRRWLAVGRTHIEQAFMAINRAIFKPSRVKLEEHQAQRQTASSINDDEIPF